MKIFKNFFKNRLKKRVKKYFVNKIENGEFEIKKKIIDMILEKIDIPNVTKEAEEQLISQIYDAIQTVVLDMVEEI